MSVRTVSNVVNDFDQVSDSTRARVRAALEELGYQPNLIARKLRAGRTGVLGLFVPKLSQPYFAELADAVVAAAADRGCSVLVDQTDGRRGHERSLLESMGRGRMWDGMIMSPLRLSRGDLAHFEGQMPLVLLGEHGQDYRVARVGADNEAAARDVVSHLLDTGRRHIAVVGYQSGPSGDTGRVRARGYRQRMRSAGIRVQPEWLVRPSRFDRQAGAAAVRELLGGSHPPQAVFCFNDELALGALFALHQLGVRVPDDVAVVGWDDIIESRFCWPALTTVCVPRDEVARLAVDHVLRQRDGVVDVENILVPHRVEVRQSTVSQDAARHPLVPATMTRRSR